MPPDEVRLTVPAAPAYARIARLAAAGLATRVDFSYDEVEDLRIALGAVCSLLFGGDSTGTVELRFGLDDGEVALDATRHGGVLPGGSDAGPLSIRILDAVTDTWSRSADGAAVRLVMRHVV